MPVIQAAELRARVAALFVKAGTQAKAAQQVADNLVMANLSGHDSHGVGMAPRYVDAIAEGNLDPAASVRVQTDAGALLGLDGQHGFGQVVGVQAMELAFERVRAHGSCVMALAHAHHLGRIGHFAEMAVAQGWVALHFVSVWSRPIVAPYGGANGRFGTNPCCIGIPLSHEHPGQEPFILDFATSRVAQGKMRVAHNEGRRVPEGLLIDENGYPSTDPGVVVSRASGRMGALLPFGEYKGYGLAIACELLGGALSGGGTWHQEADERRAVVNNMLTVLIDPKRLGTQATFTRETLAFINWLRLSPPAPGSAGVQLAGEPERAARLKRGREGISVDKTTWAELEQSAAKLGASF